MASERRRPVSVTAHRRFLEAFLAAAHDGNVTDLERLLAADVARKFVLEVDPGGYDPAVA